MHCFIVTKVDMGNMCVFYSVVLNQMVNFFYLVFSSYQRLIFTFLYIFVYCCKISNEKLYELLSAALM